MKVRPESDQSYVEQLFEGLTFEGGEVTSSEFSGCEFVRCAFNEATFRSCTFEECTFRECDLSLVRLPHCSFKAVRFESCKAIGVNWSEASWPEKRIWPPLGFEKCVLDHSTFLGLDLKRVRLEQCSAKDADFRETDLSEATLNGTDLSGALFADTNLTGADLRGALNYALDPGSNSVKGVKLSLPEAMSLLAGLGVDIDGWE